MKLVIIADTNQLGLSGVGDFALLLAQSLRDCNVNVVFEALGPPDRTSLSALAESVQHAEADWVSLHFVPYTLAYQGLVSSRTLPWEKLRGRVGTHILFHEIWIGAHQGAPWRQRAIGLLQRLGIRQVLHQLKPDIIHCTNSLYSALLHNADIPNKVLPLFSNIPVLSDGCDPYPQLLTNFVPGANRASWVVATFFGSIYPSESLFSALQWLSAKCFSNGKHLLVVSLGHCPMAVDTFESLASRFSEESKPYFHVTGKLEPTALSSWIRSADCGLSTTPFNIIDKSSSSVAFVEHGVPVIVMDAGAPIRGLNFTQPDLAPEFFLFGDKRLDEHASLPMCCEPQPRRDRIVNQFLSDLTNHRH